MTAVCALHPIPLRPPNQLTYSCAAPNRLTTKTVVVLDNAGIHHGAPMRERQAEWASKGLHLLYLPPYCPELNAIEILWKQAKYFWRRFLTLAGTALRDEVAALMRGFGTDYTIAFR